MTISEVVWFINHKYGDSVYLEEFESFYEIYTKKSKWRIYKNDFAIFHYYRLYHFNNTYGKHYHVQSNGNSIQYLIWRAAMHDISNIVPERSAFNNFLKNYENYLYGQKLWNNVIKFNDECAILSFLNGDYD